MSDIDGLEETDYIGQSFEVTTVKDEYTFPIATDYDFEVPYLGPREYGDETLLVVYGDDDFEDGSIELRVFNMSHVIDYGWSE